MCKDSGFSLVELLSVVAIVAILAAVAIPSYVNYRNRAIQSEAIETLLRAKMDQEIFRAENQRYADTVRLLYSFGSTNVNTFTTPNGYVVSVVQDVTDDFHFRVRAEKTIYAYAQADTIAITESDDFPIINNEDALKFSLFKWLFP